MASMEQQVPSPFYRTNVLLFKDEDVTRSNGEMYTPNLMELSTLRKTDQFRKDVRFHKDMSDIDVGNTLKGVFPVLIDRRFLCATSAVGNNARLDFDGERRVWNGATIKKKAKGNRCLYIVPEVEQVAHTLDDVTMFSPQPTQNESPQGSGQQPQGAPLAVVLPQNMQSTSAHGGFQSTQQYQLQSVATLMAGTQPPHQQHQHHQQLGSSLENASMQSVVSFSPPITSAVEVLNNQHIFFPSVNEAQLQQSTPLPQLSQQMFSNTIVKTSESSESDYYSEVFSEENLQQGNQASEQNTTSQKGRAEICENRGPLEGRMAFELLLHGIQLPASVWVLKLMFGSNGVYVQKHMDGSWLGKTPRGDSYGTVTVQIMDGNSEVARTEYTYVDKDLDAYETVVRNFELQVDLFSTFHENQSNAGLPGNSNTANRSITGELEQEDQPQQVDVLRRMLYTAARIGVAPFAQMVFSTSAGRVMFETYKNTPPLPEDIAEANGHNDLAAYFRGITERFSNEDDTNQPRSSHINWLELPRAVQQREHPSGTSKACMKELRKEGSSESVYFGDVEASSSDSDRERSGSENESKRMVSGAGISIHHGHASGKDEELLHEDKTEVLPECKIPGKNRIDGEGDESSSFLSELHETTSEEKGPGEWIQASAIEMALDPSHQLTESDIHCYELPDEIGDNWRNLARALGYKEAKIRSIETEKGNSNKECCIDLLVRWLHKKGRDATAGKLAEALAKIELKSFAEKFVKPNDPSQNFKMSARIRKAKEEGSKMSAAIKELEEKHPKLRGRIKELEDANQQVQKVSRHTDPGARPKQTKPRDQAPSVNCEDDKNESTLNDLQDTARVLRDTDQAARELRISERLENLNQEFNTYVTAPLEVSEVKQDQLKTPIKLVLLSRLSERLQELYSDIQAMVSETCKCGEDLRRDFYDFVYHGLRVEHNELIHRVKDLESTEPEMSEEERENFAKLQKYQVNRQRCVERLDNVWRGLFSPPERLPKTPWSDTTGISDNSKESKKLSRYTDPGARPKQTKPRDQALSVNCEDDKNEFTLQVIKRKIVKNIFRKKRKDEYACVLVSCSKTRYS